MDKPNKHTPGPWHTIEIAKLAQGEPLPFLLANKTPHAHGTFELHNRADAALIAAAPEMLEALEALVDDYKKRPKVYKILMNIIKKARGES